MQKVLRRVSLFVLFSSFVVCRPLEAAEHRIELLEAKAPGEEISEEIAATLQPTGVRVLRGKKRKVCDLWLCKEWQLPSFNKKEDVNYPFVPGQLIGVVRYNSKGGDFRDQDIAKGVYTLRYAQQPVDGAHVGTSATRDFLLLIEAANDESPEIIDYETLAEDSAAAAGSSHPCLLSLQEPGEAETTPSISENEQAEWWIIRLVGQATDANEAQALPIDLVVAGQAAE